MELAAKFAQDLARLAQTGESVELLNHYQEVPLLYPATVEKVEGGIATLKSDSYEAVCLALEGQTIILNPRLDDAIGGHVSGFDIAAGTARLDQFYQAGAKIGDRANVRVAPKGALEVQIEGDGQARIGQLSNLSVHGLGVILPEADVPSAFRMRGATLHLTFRLPRTTVQLPGMVRYVQQDPTGVRLGLNFARTLPAQHVIAEYVALRRVEILDELRAVYAARRREAGP